MTRLRPRPRALVAATLVALAVAAGCGAVTELLQLSERIQREGYTQVEVFHNDFGAGTSNEVRVDAAVGRGEPPPAGQEEIAEIVWTTYPRRLDLVTVALADDLESFDRGQLTTLFGPRDPTLDEREFSDDLSSGFRTAGIVSGLVLLVVLVVVLLLVRRSRRRRQEQWPGMQPMAPSGYATFGPGQGPPPGAAPFGAPPPPYGAPPPPYGAPPPPLVAPPPPGSWPPPPAGGVPPPPGAPPPPASAPPPAAAPPPANQDWPPPSSGSG